MNQMLSAGRGKAMLTAVLLLLAGLPCLTGACRAAEAETAGGGSQIETTVIHVDQYAVYAPGLVFYFDSRMDKRKVAAIMKTADQLRNKKAVITYSAKDELGKDKHVLLVDITAAAAPERPVREASAQTGDAQPQPQRNQPPNPAVPTGDNPAEPRSPIHQAEVEPNEPPVAAGQSAPITRDEVTAFVRRMLELNQRKDLPAITPYYAERVDYYDRGLVDREYVKRDLGYYFRNWDTITTTLDGDVVMIVIDQPDLRIAKFVSSFSVRNEKKVLAGKTENIWKIQRINGQLRLVDVKQRVITRQ